MRRQLIDTVGFVERPERRHDVTGELLPAEAESRALAPVNVPTRQPVISIQLPQARADATDDAPVSEYERRKAQRPVTWESDVKVPVAQAGMTALAFGIMAALLAWAFGWSWRVPIVVTALAVALAWLWRLRIVDALLWQVEVIAQRDVNHDGRIGPPTGYTVANPHVARQQAGRSARADAAERQRAALVAFLHRCYTAGCSEQAHGVKATGPDRAAYVAARDTLLALGIATWRNAERPRAGWVLAVSEAEALALLSEHVL